ncbi:hypothetical protein HCU01_01520 [Halomonas cupida]|uniref:Uncharacterized protein n=1 Tax=Halomonas cupida TaxID=44933 RepID=A0A1M7B050_9GAMM|nr:hypothetical protein HCU01_01520 [Halomonas cupida]SHL48029.1 hypothetical protein SAMN05660971_00698 [Halomonas cupida]
MQAFIINKNAQSNGDHEVHSTTARCSYMPELQNQINLGAHATCHDAVSYAKQQHPGTRINGCYYCCNPCHTT